MEAKWVAQKDISSGTLRPEDHVGVPPKKKSVGSKHVEKFRRRIDALLNDAEALASELQDVLAEKEERQPNALATEWWFNVTEAVVSAADAAQNAVDIVGEDYPTTNKKVA